MSPLRCFFVVQPSISHYREPFIRALLQNDDIQFTLAGKFRNPGRVASNTVEPASSDLLARTLPLGRFMLGNLTWEKGVVAALLGRKYDVVVLEGRVYTISTWIAASVAKVRGMRVLYWGHGWTKPDRGGARFLRRIFYRLADGLLLYGNRARRLGVEAGQPASKMKVVYNSIYRRDSMPGSRSESVDGARARSALDIPQDALVYSSISRLTRRHRVDILIDAVARSKNRARCVVLIGGNGEERERLEDLARERAVEARFLGGIYDFDLLATLYAASDYCVIPGWAGLNVIQALGFGCPVITHDDPDNQPPEAEAVIEGLTGFHFEAGNVSALADRLDELSDQSGLIPRGPAFENLLDQYSADGHAAAIAQGIRRVGAGDSVG